MAAERRSTAAAAAAVIVLDSSDDDGDNDNTRKKSSGAAKSTRETTAAATTTFTHTKLSPPTTSNNNRINRGTKSVRILSTSPAPTAAVSPTTASSATRRIKPTLLSTTVSSKRPRLHGADSDDDDDDVLFTFGSPSPPKKPCPPSSVQTPPSPAASRSKSTAAATTTTTPKTPISAAFGALLAACRAADPSDDMEQLITRKLTRYYHTVHPDYVGSKSFRKEALRVAAAIRAQPSHVYLKLAGILEELNIRRKSGAAAVAVAAAAAAATDDANAAAQLDVKPSAAVNKAIIAKTEPDTAETTAATDDAADQSPTAGGSTAAAAGSSSASPTAGGGGVAESPSTGNAKKDQQIKRLNHALYVLKKRIASLDEAEVDLNDEENSTFLLVERYKKRACEIYEKICDITGESKNACRSLRKPIVFQGTAYPLFNRTIQSFVNRTKTFPDLFDVRRCLDHCNQQYEFDLSKEEVLRVAQDAFVKIGKLLQRRRKLDLYETVAYFTTIGDGSGETKTTTAEGADAGGAIGVAAMATMVDPATNDVQLQRKLAENDAAYTRRINAIIDKYADIQDRPESAKSIPVKSETTATTDKAENAEATSADDKSANTNPITTTEADEEAPSTISVRSGNDVAVESAPAETVDDANSSCIILDDD